MVNLIIITGQTATGKTKLALEYAEKYNGELINCDSRQIYKKLDIITGKDLPKNSKSKFIIQKKINNFDIGFYPILTNFNKSQQISTKLWLYDIVDPSQYFSSYDWMQCALTVIKDILNRKKTPIIVGGTYFYLYHLLYSVETENIKPNWELRNELNNKSISELQSILASLSPQFINELSQSELYNRQRLIRKIEILSANKNLKISSFKIPAKFSLSQKLGQSIKIKYLGLCHQNNDDLKKAIKKRVEERLKNGAVKEVKNLLQQGYSDTDPGLKTIGYQQIIKSLKGFISKKQAIEEWITKEIQYAKRQYNFMKKDDHLLWYSI